MCGIAGILGKSDFLDVDIVMQLLSKIEHRGRPGTLYETYYSDQKDFAVGTNRLPIVRPETNGQPAISPKKKILVIMNGEVFNFNKLREELIQLDSFYFTINELGDTHVLAASIEAWGLTETLKKIVFEGAFVAIDLELKNAYLVRDHIGIKPLYFVDRKNALVFASEMKALKAFANNYQISQLEPGSIACYNIEEKTLKYKSWWSIADYKVQEKQHIDLLEETLKLLDNSVYQRVPKDEQYAVLLSGGIDSSLILKLSVKYNKNVTAYTLCNDNSPDLPYARQLCSDLGVKLVEVKAASAEELRLDLFDLISTIEAWEWHVVNHAAPMKNLFKKIKEDGHKIVLTGEGADEIFFGYDTYQQDIDYKALENKRIERIKNLNRTNCQRLDRMSMLFSLETRVPFLDKKLVEFALNISASMCITNLMNKLPLRMIAKDILPKNFYNRKKLSFAKGVGYQYGQGTIQSVFGDINSDEVNIHDDWLELPRFPIEKLFLNYFIRCGYSSAVHMKSRSI